MDSDINDIWEDCERELDAQYKMGSQFQMLCEEAISNIAALKMINDDSIEEAVKN